MEEFHTPDAYLFPVGTKLQIGPRPRWYVRLWNWLRRRPKPVVVGCDPDTGTLTVENWNPKGPTVAPRP